MPDAGNEVSGMTRLELERERALLAALRGVALDLKEPSFDPQREQALLTIFDEAWVRRAAHRQAPVWSGLAAAAVLLGAVFLAQFASRPGAPGMRRHQPQWSRRKSNRCRRSKLAYRPFRVDRQRRGQLARPFRPRTFCRQWEEIRYEG